MALRGGFEKRISGTDMVQDSDDRMTHWLNLYPPRQADKSGREPAPPRGESKSPYLDDIINALPGVTLDLHGMTGVEAEALIKKALRDAVKRGIRKISIIHGRGLHSDGNPVLPELVKKVLTGSEEVIRFGNEPRNRGGDGATWAILRSR
jgi:dsDNA-specific endonuclease/ATPase MutS2